MNDERTDVIDRIFTLFREYGDGAYFGEAVSVTEHALQSANLAAGSGANAELVAAALLHDIGHLLHGLGEDIAAHGVDARHEEGGSVWLARYFGPAIVDPVRLHVAAKRYLCSVETSYYAGLSPTSRRSLELQGGLMTADEIRRFQEEPWHRSAVLVARVSFACSVFGADTHLQPLVHVLGGDPFQQRGRTRSIGLVSGEYFGR